MPAVVILGLRIPFKALWEKVGIQERSICGCPETTDQYSYCPHCGSRKTTKKIRVYRSLITGENTTYRNIDSIMSEMLNKGLDIYDPSPRGYTDDSVYIYFTNPNCHIEVSGTEAVSMTAIQKYPYEIEDWMRELLGDKIWKSGIFGLWAFMSSVINPAEKSTKKMINKGSISDGDDPDNLKTFIIPLGPFNQ